MGQIRKLPPQHQRRRPGLESKMMPKPKSEGHTHHGTGKLQGKVALITGGDSGIGRAVAIAFAREGADVTIIYLDEHTDAAETRYMVQKEGRRCLTIDGDIGTPQFCHECVGRVLREFGRVDILGQ